MPPAAFALRCCLCGSTVPQAKDVYALDAEWKRRFPRMTGTLACEQCALFTTKWACRQPGTGTYVTGHIPAAEERCFDSWSHVGPPGTQRAMMCLHPRSALLQGGEPYLRDLTARAGVTARLATRINAALRDWDAQRAEARQPLLESCAG